ncbi:GNAT family N-acetyltransferase [Paenibacillus sp. XY044]|uniref:GNAT family N-acetyltransferase n=1 Tax=Paenibacillus sp. XY044 TaxID=2026089 RepID=UPI000B99847D|nr:GNAT family N-acetyltransferase [Paenibacillus sp. XY044]OZB90134.1 GNAT family N-acetyltransferase [Paenibacillus sp. XY044]
MWNYRSLGYEDAELINGMDASQFIKNAWREVAGKRQLVEINYHDKDWPNGYPYHLEHLRETIRSGGEAIGAFDENDNLVGFAAINRDVFGDRYRYVLLDQLFITLEQRGKGNGKKLFSIAAHQAREWGAEKLYICAGSSEETIAFYHAMGCREAAEVNRTLLENDPRDVQLEFVL